jgi:peptidyl-prolyl cis-trans isomerase C
MPAIVRHILTRDRELAVQLKQQLVSGADFAKLAKQHSTCPSGKKGGELGEVRKGQLVAPVDRAVFQGAEHEIQGPIKSSFGFHLVQVKFRY